jgi:hypothetical protein
MFLLQSTGSLQYILLHNVAAYLTNRGRKDGKNLFAAAVRWLAVIMARINITLWLAACGMNVTFTIARGPYCFIDPENELEGMALIDAGTTCIVQRTGVGASLMSLYVKLSMRPPSCRS